MLTTAERWKQIAAGPEREIDLVEAALLIAAPEYPGLDIPGYLAKVADLAATLKRRLRGDIGPTDTLIALNHYFFGELGFAGNAEHYYDPRNSFFNEVLDRRLGIPITLALAYIEIGRRVGLALHGVSFPGHFLVKCTLRDGAAVLDPYAHGVSLGIEDLQQRLRALHGGGTPSADKVRHLLAVAGNKGILARMLRNLKAIYREQGDLPRALAAVDRIIAIEPGVAEEYRDRAELYHGMECFRAALADFRSYLMLNPKAEDFVVVQRKVADLQRIAARLN